MLRAELRIEDHIVTGAYDMKLAEGWDFVVLKQGPSSLPQNRDASARVVGVRAGAVGRAHWEPGSFGSRRGPQVATRFTWLDAELSYQLAARAARGCIAPVATDGATRALPCPKSMCTAGTTAARERGRLRCSPRTSWCGRNRNGLAAGPPDMTDAIEDPSWRVAAVAQRRARCHGAACRDRHWSALCAGEE